MTYPRRSPLAGLITVVLVAIVLMLSSPAAAAVLFFDDFNPSPTKPTGVRPEWRNEFGSWISTGSPNGVYHATTGQTQYVRSTVGLMSGHI